MEKYNPPRYGVFSGNAHRVCLFILALACFYPCVVAASPPDAGFVPPPIPSGGPWTTACPQEPQPTTFTCDGYPSFNPRNCWASIYSTDGKNTNGTGQGSMTDGGSGYQCWEFASRYFQYRFKVDFSAMPLTADASQLCQAADYDAVGIKAQVTFHARGNYIPVPGDLAIYDQSSAAIASGLNNHVAVVLGTDQTNTHIYTANEHFGPDDGDGCSDPSCAVSGYDEEPINGPCGYWHANANTSTPNTCAADTQGSDLAPVGPVVSDPVVVAHATQTVPTPNSEIGTTDTIMAAGELEVFYVGTTNQIWHVWQTTTGPVTPTTWSKPAFIDDTVGGKPIAPAGQVAVMMGWQANSGGNALFYVDQYQEIYTTYDGSFGASATFDPHAKYTWSAPASISPKNTAISNITAVEDSNGFPTLFFIGLDHSVMKMVNSKSLLNVSGTYDWTTGWSKPAIVTTFAGNGADSGHSEVASAYDPAGGGYAVFFRGPDDQIWLVPPTPGANTSYDGGGSTSPTPTVYNLPPTRMHGHSTSNITVALGANGYLQLFYRADDGGLQSIKQVGNWAISGSTKWDSHFNLMGMKGKNAMTNTAGVAFLTDQVFSNIAQAYNQNLRSQIFYIDYLGNVMTLWETEMSTLKNGYYPVWTGGNKNAPSAPYSLGTPDTTPMSQGGMAGYFPISECVVDTTGQNFTKFFEGLAWGLGSGGAGFIGMGPGYLAAQPGAACQVNGQTYTGLNLVSNGFACGVNGTSPDGVVIPQGAPACGSLPQTDYNYTTCAMGLEAQALNFQTQNLIHADGINPSVQVTQNMCDALLDLVFNAGYNITPPGQVVQGLQQLANDLNTGTPPYQDAATQLTQTGLSASNQERLNSRATLFCTGSAQGSVTTPCTAPAPLSGVPY